MSRRRSFALTTWQGALNGRPKYWGKLVIELVYDTLDPDAARYLRENRPLANVRRHQNLKKPRRETASLNMLLDSLAFKIIQNYWIAW
ncbi:P63C domain-containing protein [Mesorhizobium dulcispinae]|uniref:P63C domain-containing protein n=1 Tax=Mesorhizobium dulcispinae TaxID=3072316 RepID=UPI003D31FC5E